MSERDPTPPAAAPSDAEGLAEQALENLVNQFARPLDFLRELVQNSVDAGSPRVEVRARYRRAQRTLELSVRDWGEGMDEAIIDGHLTRLFSSSKEDDLTRIGKFGIGFTSVFAIEPDAVLVRTGRHGEAWELLFHPDRSFDKVRLSSPTHGTVITLLKSLNERDAETTIRDSRWTLRWWCEHTDTPVLFFEEPGEEERAPSPAAGDPSADPFAAFAAPPALAPRAETISRPLDVDAEPKLRRVTPLAEVVIGYGASPRYGFFNGGLTLVNSASLQLLGEHAPRLQHLTFKVKSRHIEHTLTRDNILRDGSWARVMREVVKAADALREALLDRVEAAVEAGEPLGAWHERLLTEVEAPGGAQWARGARERRLLRCWGGAAMSFEALEQQEDLHGVVPLAAGPAALLEALSEDGVGLIEDHPTTRRLLEGWPNVALLERLRGRRLVEAGSRWVAPRGAELGALPARLRRLVEDADALLRAASRGRLQLRAVHLGGLGALAMEGPAEDRIFARGRPGLLSLPAPARRRVLLLDLDHPSLVPLQAAALGAPQRAALALAQAAAHADGQCSEGLFQRLLSRAMEAP